MLLFKYNELETEFDALDERLRKVAFSLAGFVMYTFGKHLFLTSVHRPDNPHSTHAHYRAFDFRITPKSGEYSLFTDNEIQAIETFCEGFIYDKDRLELSTLFVHDAGTGLHGHVQVNNDEETIIINA